MLVKNHGAAFGILKNRQKLLKIMTVIMMLCMVVYLYYAIATSSPIILILALVLITGGALGNIIDRFRLNYVVDFININIRRFPVFNLADVFILTGSILFVIYSIKIG